MRRVAVLDVASRVAAAAIGGYALAYAVAWSLAVGLTGSGALSRVDATILSSFLAFVVHLAVILGAFVCRSAARLWLILAGLGLAAGLPVLLLGDMW